MSRCVCVVIAASLATAGCGRSGKAVPSSSGSSSERSSSSASRSAADEPASKNKGEGRRYVGDVPLDVWFDDPLSIAGNKTPLGSAGVTATSTPPVGSRTAEPESADVATTAKKAPAEPATSPAPATGDWKAVINGEMIADEAKSIRSHISNSLQTVSKYNGNYKDIQVDAAVLAALAGIAASHPDSIGWKKDAAIVRDLAAEVGKKAKGLAQPNFDNTKTAFDRLDGLLSGNRPPDLAKAEPKVPFHDVAPRAPLMRRMNHSSDWLRSVDAKSLKSSSDKVAQEAAVLASLSRVLATEGYPSADEAEYQKFLKELTQSCQTAAAAARDGDINAFKTAFSRTQKACNECHQNYRFSDGG